MDNRTIATEGSARSLLEPLSTVVTVICGLMAVLLALRGYAAIGLGGAFGWEDGTVCALDPHRSSSFDESAPLFESRSGIAVSVVPEYCDLSPDGGTRLLSTLTQLPSSVLYIGALFLLYRLLRGARGDGPFTARTAVRLRMLGWYLAAGALLCHLTESIAAEALTNALRPADWPLPHGIFLFEDFPYFATLTGVGLLCLARILRAAAAMRQDLEGVV